VAGRNEKEAADNFLGFLHETLSCITAQPLTAFQQSKKLYKVWFNPPAELTTRSGARLFLSFTQVLGAGPDTQKPGEFKVSTREYSYRLLQGIDVASREILAYHWHPNDSALRDPHLHIRSVGRVHFPTSRICLEDFVCMLIKYYGVRPKMMHSEWTAIITKTKRLSRKWPPGRFSIPASLGNQANPLRRVLLFCRVLTREEIELRSGQARAAVPTLVSPIANAHSGSTRAG
jgi:hypothetical protein